MVIRSRTARLIYIEDNLFPADMDLSITKPYLVRVAECLRNNNNLVLGQEVKGPCPPFSVYTYLYSMAVALRQGPPGRSLRDGLLDAPRVATDEGLGTGIRRLRRGPCRGALIWTRCKQASPRYTLLMSRLSRVLRAVSY